MQTLVQVDHVGDVAVLTMAHPPVNALSASLRHAIATALHDALTNPAITAIILAGEGRGFSAGADITEFGKPSQAPRLGALAQQIENANKPVIAAIHGMALGGGLELALAAHYRVAATTASLGLPETQLGLLPGAGGTQRLPRLVGAAAALQIMLTGTPLTGPEAQTLGLIDRITDTDPTEAAIILAAEGLVPRRSCDMRRGLKDMIAYQAAIKAARDTYAANPMPSPHRIIDCVEAAALLPFAQGLTLEETAFTDLVATPEAAGLRHAFFVERRAGLPPFGIAAKAPAITRLGLWAVDDMVSDLALQALTAGLHVVWASPDRATLTQGLARTAAQQEQAVAAGSITEEQRDTAWGRLTTSLTPEALAECDLVLTATGAPALPDAQTASARAAIGALPMGQGGPRTAIAIPQGPGGLAELSLTADADPQTVARLMALARSLKWRIVFAGPGGPIELHLRQALAAAAEQLAATGMDAATIAVALAHHGLGMSATATSTLPRQVLAETLSTCLAALAVEGARMVQDGRARRPLDVDAVALLSGIMPRWMGGPMFQADQRGLLVLRQDLRRRASTSAQAAALFTPPQLVDDLISEAQPFAFLNTI